MPIGDRIGGFIRPGFNPLLVTDAPTIGTASSGGSLAISIAFTAPSDVGGGAITSYEAIATDTVTAAVFTASGSSSPITVTGLTEGQTYTVTVSATNAYGPSSISAASNSFEAVAAGELWSWGYNNKGQLGVGNITNTSSPVQVGALTTWSQLSNADMASFALKTDGTLWSWGQGGYYGQLGHNNLINYSSPVQVGALTDWLVVGAGRYFCHAIKTDGTLWGWGRNVEGNLGTGNTTAYSSPVQIGALTNWLRVAGGGAAEWAAAIKTDGTLWVMGNNASGQLGLGDIAQRSSPVQVGALTTWSNVTCGMLYALAIKTDGTLWAWGEGNDGPLGQGNTIDYSSPVQVGALTTWAAIAAGGDSTTGSTSTVKTDGTAWLWGAGNYGALGLGNTTNYSSPVQLGALTTWSKVTAGKRFKESIKTDGTLWAWGGNTFGALGDGSTTDRSSPVQIGALTTWIALSQGVGQFHNLAIKS